MEYIKNKYYGSVIISSALMVVTYFLAYILNWVDLSKINYLEIFAVWTSYICTLLCVTQSRWNYPIGIITTAAYSYLFFLQDLPSVAFFNLYLVFSLTYGWFRWKSDTETLQVSKVGGIYWLFYGLFGLLIYCILYTINTFFGYETTYIDAIVAVLSGVAQLLLDNKKLENWGVWIIVNVLSIYLFLNQGLYLVTLQYVYFLGNAVIGYYFWKKGMING